MWSLYKLQFKTNIKSPSMVMPLFFPMIMMVLFSTTVSSPQELAVAFASVLALVVMQSGMFGFGFNFIELKDSVMLRRISSTKITKWEVLFAIMLWGFTVMMITIVWMFAVLEIFTAIGLFKDVDGNNMSMDWQLINWGGLITGVIIGIILSFPLGFFFVINSKDLNSFETKVFLYFFFAAFLGGLMLPNSNIPWFRWVGYFVPNVWNAHMIIDASYGANVFHLGGYSYTVGSGILGQGGVTTDVAGWEASLNIFLPLALGVGFFAVDLKSFKWAE